MKKINRFYPLCFLNLLVTLICSYRVEAVNCLTNGDFETGNLGSWTQEWTPVESGSLCTATAARNSEFGLWIYTANNSSQTSFSYIYQDCNSNPGDIAIAHAYIRTPPPGQWVDWVEGSYACINVSFLSSTKTILASYESPYLTTGNTPYNGPYSITTSQAPPGTAYARFTCYLYEPAGNSRQSVANFDDCLLEIESASGPNLSANPITLGFGHDLTTLDLHILNTGEGILSWNADTDSNWLSVSPLSGTTTDETDTVTVEINREGLCLPRYEGIITIHSNGGNENVEVYVETSPENPVPSEPSLVTTDGYKLLVRKRLPDNSLDVERGYILKGAVWSPASIGTSADYYSRRSEFQKWYRLDIQLLKMMNANTVYTFLDFGTDSSMIDTAMTILDYCYQNGIMVVMTVDEDGSDNTNNIIQAVNAFKDHPAILMWALGNEWNLWRPDRPKYYYHYDTLAEAAAAIQSNALQIKSLDTNHPVCSILGEINYPTNADVTNIVQNICTAVDIWGANIYRGPEFYDLFNEWKDMSTKPLFLSEFGTDAFRTTSWWPPVGYKDEEMQANFIHSLWFDLVDELSACGSSNVCLGGTVFEWNDEWWKSSTGSPSEHEADGYETTWNPIAHPDGFANEEWFGIVNIERRRRQAYFVLAIDLDIANGVDFNGDCKVNFIDFAFLGSQWLQEPGIPSTDVALNGGDGVVDLHDLALFVENWLWQASW